MNEEDIIKQAMSLMGKKKSEKKAEAGRQNLLKARQKKYENKQNTKRDTETNSTTNMD